MNPKKQKEKDRRRARKLAEEAWEAVNEGNLDLAEKLVRRAVAAQQDNPVLWLEQGEILGLRHKEAESADAYRAAISLAPTFAEAYDRLAALRFRQGFTTEAVALQREAVRHAQDNAGFAEQLAAYESVLQSEDPQAVTPSSHAKDLPNDEGGRLETDPVGVWPTRLAAYDWLKLGDRLTRQGCVVLEKLMEAADCEQLCYMFDRDELFAKTRVMDQPDFGKGTYRYFRTPIPAVVDQLRRATYPHVARIAKEWQHFLDEPEEYPPDWEAFREVCHRAGQTSSTPILLKYESGGFNSLHRDLRGAVFFPIQMAVVLSPRAEEDDVESVGFRGGEFLFCDVPERKKSLRREIAAGLGDAILFCSRDRLVKVGDIHGLQPVKHGVSRITAGTRFVLGVPFHEYR
ncbi:MAG TPA: 2OG-Fe(II) oxygenase [Gemmata sp.]|jgi:hypothetical protein|nr:2OG-Fe(II) oxygenase [Gemmata sp.]